MKPEEVLAKGKTIRGKRQVGLESQVKMFPTPSTLDSIDRKGMRPSRAATNRKTGYLSEMVRMLPTPTNSMVTMADMEQAKYAGNSGKRPSYQEAKMLPTPQAGANNPAAHNAMSGDFKTKLCEKLGMPITGQLNADWVELLMGFLRGFTEIGSKEYLE